MDKTELVLHLVWFIFVSQYTIITTWYSMAWSMGWDYFADLICLNFNESVKLKQGTIAKLRKFSLFHFSNFYRSTILAFPRVPHMLPVVGKGVTQVLQILFHKLTSRFWRTARIWICGVWSNFSEYIYFALTKHLLCSDADFASLLYSIGLGSSPKRLHLIFSYWKWNNNTFHVTIHMAFLALKNAIFDI